MISLERFVPKCLLRCSCRVYIGKPRHVVPEIFSCHAMEVCNPSLESGMICIHVLCMIHAVNTPPLALVESLMLDSFILTDTVVHRQTIRTKNRTAIHDWQELEPHVLRFHRMHHNRHRSGSTISGNECSGLFVAVFTA